MRKSRAVILVFIIILICGYSAEATVGYFPPEPCRIEIDPHWEVAGDQPATLKITLTDVRYSGPVKMNFIFFGDVRPLPGSERAEFVLKEGSDYTVSLQWSLDKTERCGAVLMVGTTEPSLKYNIARAEIYFDPGDRKNPISFSPTREFFRNNDLRIIDNIPTRVVPSDSKESNPEKLLEPVLIAGTVRYLRQDFLDTAYVVFSNARVKISNYQVLKDGQKVIPDGFKLAEYYTYTDENGYYECPGWEWSNVVVSVFAENDVAVVREPVFPANVIEFPEQYVAASLSFPVTYCNIDINYSAAATLLSHARKSWDFANSVLNHTIGKTTIYYSDDPGQCHFSTGCIYMYRYTIGEGMTNVWDGKGRYTLAHEYGHAVMYRAYGDNLPSYDYEGDHYLQMISDRGFAWLEGWAEFFGTAVFTTRDTNEFSPEYGYNYSHLEHLDRQHGFQRPCPYYAGDSCDHENGLDVEGAVATVLWDIYDSRETRDDSYGSDDDEVEDMIDDLWELVREARIIRLDDFHAVHVNNLYQIMCVWKDNTEFTDEQNIFRVSTPHPIDVGIETLFKHGLTGYEPVPERPSYIFTNRCGGYFGPQININWDNSGEDVSYYALRENYTAIDTFSRTESSAELIGVDPDAVNLYSIVPLWGKYSGIESEAIVAEPSGFTPASPSGVTAVHHDTECCWSISWQDNSINEKSFWVHIWYYSPAGDLMHDWILTGPNITAATYYNDYEFVDLNIQVHASDSNYCEICYPPDHIYDCHFISAGSEPLTVYNPRCIHIDGCPFLYIYDGENFEIENNLLAAIRFATSNTPNFDDYQKISLPLSPDNGMYSLKISELAEDITCFDQISMTYLDHDEEQVIVIDSGGNAYTVDDIIRPDRAVDYLGNDITSFIVEQDGVEYCSNGPGYIEFEYYSKEARPNDPIGNIPPKDWDADQPASKSDDRSANRLYVLANNGVSWDTLGSVYGRRYQRDGFYIPADYSGDSKDSIVSFRYAWTKAYRADMVGTVIAEPLPQTPINLIPISMSKNGGKEVTKILDRDDGDTVVVSSRDTLLLQFEAPPLKKGMVREFIFHASGYYIYRAPEDPPEKPAELPKTWDYTFENHPNPFNSSTVFSFSLPSAGEVAIELYNILGRRVTTVADDYFAEGRHEVIWNGLDSGGKPAASGVYFARLKHRGKSLTKKLILLK